MSLEHLPGHASQLNAFVSSADVARHADKAYALALDHLSDTLGPSWRPLDWVDRRLQWRFLRPPLIGPANQGWKIHVSAAAVEAAKLLKILAPVLRTLATPFKIPRRLDDVVFLNSGDAGSEQVGKIITLYPADDDAARAALLRLDAAWPTSLGPEVRTDLHVRPGSAVSSRYGVYKPTHTLVDSTGRHHDALVGADGRWQSDERVLDATHTRFRPPLAMVPPTPCPLAAGLERAVGMRRFMPLARLHDTARVATWLAVDVETLETVVIKVGRAGVAGDALGRDIGDLLSAEFDTLRALESVPGLAPRALAFEEGAWPTLVMEDVRGELLSELPHERQLSALPLVVAAVAALHRAGFVHGDLKLSNMIQRDGAVVLIDFELASATGQSMRHGGSRGYLAPEVTPHQPAATARDVYALGGCALEAALGVPPGLLPKGTGRWQLLMRLAGAPQLAEHVARWMHPDPAQRPAANEVAVLLSAQNEHASRRTDGVRLGRRHERVMARAMHEAGRATAAFQLEDAAGLRWRNAHFMSGFECEGLNLGAAGIVLGLTSIDASLGRDDHSDALYRAARWLAGRPPAWAAAGLFTGNAGVALALAVVGHRLSEKEFLQAARKRLMQAASDHRELDLFSGVAGVLWTCCLLAETINADWPLQLAAPLAIRLRRRRVPKAPLPAWSFDASGVSLHLGAAHGAAGVALALSAWGRLTGDSACSTEARDAMAQLVAGGRTADGCALRMLADEESRHAVGNWCHGVAGHLWCILNGPGDDPALTHAIDWCVEVLTKAPIAGTPSYCHGLAGQLELWAAVGRLPRHRKQAVAQVDRVLQALLALRVRSAGGRIWTSDDPEIMTPDLWIGQLGPATAMAVHRAGCDTGLLSSDWLGFCAGTSNRLPARRSRQTIPQENARVD